MPDIFAHKAPKSIAVIPFYGTAALFFLLLSILLLACADELSGHHFNPHILAIVHTAVLGWGTMIIFGAMYQLLPVICEEDLYSTSLAFMSYLFLLSGTILLVGGFWFFKTGPLLITAGSLIVVASCLYAANIFVTAWKATKSNVYIYFMVVSALWLLFTTTAGLLLAINLSYTFIARNHLDLLKLHAHAGIVGWFLLLICGVGAKLIPMFLLGNSKKQVLLYGALIMQNTGLVLYLIDGYYQPSGALSLVYAAFIACGTICWLLFIMDTYRSRLRKRKDTLMIQVFISLTCKVLAFMIIPLMFIKDDSRWVSIYGIFLFLGWLTGIILGKTFKTLPFIVWNNHYQKVIGNRKVPMPKQLYHHGLIKYQLYLYVGALTLLLFGILIDNLYTIQIALVLWIILALLYCYNVFTTIFHKPQLAHEDQP